MQIDMPRFTETTPEGQVKELRRALVRIVNEANAEIQRLERKIISLGGNKDNGV